LGALAHMAAPLHTQPCLSHSYDEIELDRSMLGFWVEGELFVLSFNPHVDDSLFLINGSYDGLWEGSSKDDITLLTRIHIHD
jgi:hypothetical protein